jgi:choline monooxygenase
LNDLKPDLTLSKDYNINANWALYCDNYLEGFHVPFVHKDLNEVLDYNSYKTEVDKFFNLQIGYGKNKAECFNIPKSHKDYGKNIAAYYYWIFPNLMLNFYPWGISINLVCPESNSKTKILFRSYVFDKTKLNHGASSDLDKVEMEDEEIVETVQMGIKSSFYNTGRFSPTMERGVHHFHSLISNFLNKK